MGKKDIFFGLLACRNDNNNENDVVVLLLFLYIVYIGNSSWLLCPDHLESIALVQQTDQPYIRNKINNYSTMAKTKKISIQCVSSLRAKEVNTLTNYMRYCWIDVHCDDAMCTADSGSSESCIAYERCVRVRLVHLRRDQCREFVVLLD